MTKQFLSKIDYSHLEDIELGYMDANGRLPYILTRACSNNLDGVKESDSKKADALLSEIHSAGRDYYLTEAFTSLVHDMTPAKKSEGIIESTLLNNIAQYIAYELMYVRLFSTEVIEALRLRKLKGVRFHDDSHASIKRAAKAFDKAKKEDVPKVFRPMVTKAAAARFIGIEKEVHSIQFVLKAIAKAFFTETDKDFRIEGEGKDLRWYFGLGSSCKTVFVQIQPTKHDIIGQATEYLLDSNERVENMKFSYDMDLKDAFGAIFKSEDFYKDLTKTHNVAKKGKYGHVTDMAKEQQEHLSHDLDKVYQEYRAVNFLPFTMKHVIDDRGRISPIGLITSVSSKKIRSLLRNGEAVKLGPKGLDAIYIGLAGAMGKDKISNADRIQYSKDNRHTLAAVGVMLLTDAVAAYNMIKALGADNPFKALGFCLELHRIDCFEGNVEDYKTTIFVSSDGTCSGSQHISLMMKAQEAGKACNVVSDTLAVCANDFYMLIINAMDDIVAADKDADEYSRYFTMMDKKDKRKLCKTNIMVVPYGAGRSVFQKNFEENIKQFLSDEQCTDEYCLDFAVSLTKLFIKVYNSHPAVKPLMDYMKFVKAIGKAYNTTAVTQPIWSVLDQDFSKTYYQDGGTRKEKVIDGKRVRTTVYLGEMEKISASLGMNFNKKIKTDPDAVIRGIAPNFVHSHDAAFLHGIVLGMTGTLNLCHDSIGCTPADFEKMHGLFIERWLDIYKDHTILEDLAARCLADTGIEVALPEGYVERPHITEEQIRNSIYSFC